MPQPSTSLATRRPDLSGAFQEFDLEMNRRNFIGSRILPVFEVEEDAGKYPVIPIEQLLAENETRRAPKSGYNRGEFEFETGSYITEEHGWEEPLDDREVRMYRHYIQAEMIATARAVNFVAGAAERRIASAIFNSTTFNTTAVTNEWDDLSNATPIDDVEAAVIRVYDATGLWPNTLVITNKVFRNLRRCSQVLDRIESSGAGNATKARDVTLQMLAQVFDLEKILVGNASKNTAGEGQSASISPVWSNEYAWVGKTAETGDIQEPCVGRSFHWDEDGSTYEGRVESYRDESIRSDVIRVRHDTDEKIMYAACGELLENITT